MFDKTVELKNHYVTPNKCKYYLLSKDLTVNSSYLLLTYHHCYKSYSHKEFRVNKN